MKLFIISDIHGSLYYLKKAVEIFENEKADYILILGDALYHGPRNPLPKDYNPQEVAALLNGYKEKIIAVRGNCDSEVDQMMLQYPMMGEYVIILDDYKKILLTHGHIYNKDNLPNLCGNNVIMHGHTHIPVAEKFNGIYLLNPGSIALPKQNYPNSYGLMQNDLFEIKDLDGNVIKSLHLI